MKKYAPLVLRTGIAIVFLWFGFSQLKNPASWTRMIPDYASAMLPFSPNTIIYFNGIFEILLAILLLLGLYTRVTSFLLGVHLLHITSIVGYGAVGARDLALTLATFAIFLNGADEFTIDAWRKKKETTVPVHTHSKKEEKEDDEDEDED